MLSDSIYNKLKGSATIVLPAAGALYFALAQIWGLPNGEQIVGSIAALNVFVGVVLGLSTKSYNGRTVNPDGTPYVGMIDVASSPTGGKVYSLNLNGDPEALERMQDALFKVANK